MKAIYGAGGGGRILFDVISKIEKIDFFIDNQKEGKWCDLPIRSVVNVPDNTVIYNSVAMCGDLILKELINKGYTGNFVFFGDILKQFPDILKAFFTINWFVNCDTMDAIRLKKTRELFKDKISLNFFDKWLAFRKKLTMDFYPFPTNTLQDHYMPNGLEIKFNNFIDCGAFTGDTAEPILKKNPHLDMLVCFEPDITCREMLNDTLISMKMEKAIIIPMGVSNHNGVVRFSSELSRSKIEDNGDLEISITTLDATVYHLKPEYIKMDIEGGEYKAIEGSAKIIRDYSPNLAISIYHKAEDLWELPLLINSINPNYNYYIRSHNHLCFETVLYCIPKH